MGVYRSIPAQMNIVKDKWDPSSVQSPLRTYLYQHVADETEALRYRPGPNEDENKWEEAVNNRPGPTWVPLLVHGFFELGKKAQIQMEAIQKCNMMLQEINTSLDYQLNTHRQTVATRLAECKRRQIATSRKTLALAVKVQILRNKGYVMDNAEEELKEKLQRMEREVFDPSLDAREQEFWARMLGIRERAKRIKVDMEKVAPTPETEQPILDDATVEAARQVSTMPNYTQTMLTTIADAGGIRHTATSPAKRAAVGTTGVSGLGEDNQWTRPGTVTKEMISLSTSISLSRWKSATIETSGLA